MPKTLLKERLRHRCFQVNFATFLRTSFFAEYLWVTASVLGISSLSNSYNKLSSCINVALDLVVSWFNWIKCLQTYYWVVISWGSFLPFYLPSFCEYFDVINTNSIVINSIYDFFFLVFSAFVSYCAWVVVWFSVECC